MRGFAIAWLVVVVLLAGCTAAEPESASPSAADRAQQASQAGDRAAHTATQLADGSILVTGGCVVDGCGIASSDVLVVGADGRTVTAGAPMSVPRTNHTATLLYDGRVVIAGGFMGEGEGVTGSIDVLDVGAGTTTAAASAMARGGHAAALLPDGRVLIVGGDSGDDGFTASAEIFDPMTGSLAAASPLPWRADALEASTLHDGRVLVTGGRVARETGTTSAALYDPVRGAWTEVGGLSVPRFKHFQVTMADGRVLVGGGTPDDRRIHASTDVFDPALGEFSAGPVLTEPRYKLSGGALALSGARVLVGAGGRSVEIVDVDARTSTVVADLERTASFATVSSLGTGCALVLGGYDDGIALTGLMLQVALDGGATSGPSCD